MSVTMNPNIMGRNGKRLNNFVDNLNSKDKPKPEDKKPKPKPLNELSFKGLEPYQVIESEGRENPRNQVLQGEVLGAPAFLIQQPDGEEVIVLTKPLVTGMSGTNQKITEFNTDTKSVLNKILNSSGVSGTTATTATPTKNGGLYQSDGRKIISEIQNSSLPKEQKDILIKETERLPFEGVGGDSTIYPGNDEDTLIEAGQAIVNTGAAAGTAIKGAAVAAKAAAIAAAPFVAAATLVGLTAVALDGDGEAHPYHGDGSFWGDYIL